MQNFTSDLKFFVIIWKFKARYFNARLYYPIVDIDYKVQREMLRRGYSNRTIKTYLNCIHKFFKKCHKEPSKVSKSDVREYLNDFIEKDAAGNTINVNLNALKFLFEEILNKRMRLNIKYSKIP